MSDHVEGQPGGAQRETAAPGSDLVPTGAEAVGLAEGQARDEVMDAEIVEDEAVDARPDPTPAWVNALTGAGLGLVIVQALVLVGTFSQGMAIGRFDGNFLHKIGVALLSNVGSANGLTLLVAAALAALPSLVGAYVGEAQQRRQALVFGGGAVLAVLLIVGTPIAVMARIHVLDVGGQEVDALARRVLATYVAGTLGTALVALAACLGLSRQSRTVTPSP